MTVSLTHRENTAPTGTTKVVVYPRGADVVASSASVGVQVAAGHSFCPDDKLLRTGSAQVYSDSTTVQSIVAKVLTLSASFTVQADDLVVNLGPDTGSGSPAFDASKMQIYSDSLGATLISQAAPTLTGLDYTYYHKGGGGAWEVCLDVSDNVLAIYRNFEPIDGLHAADFGPTGAGDVLDNDQFHAAILAIEALEGTLFFWPDDTFKLSDEETISSSNVTLDFRGASICGPSHRIFFSGDSGIHGDLSQMLTNVHVKNLNVATIGGSTSPKPPRFNFCRNSSMVNVTKTGRTGSAFHLYACQNFLMKDCVNSGGRDTVAAPPIGYFIYLCDDTVIEDCSINGDNNEPFYIGLQIKGGQRNIVRRFDCTNIHDGAELDIIYNVFCRGDAPWKVSSTGDIVPMPTYPLTPLPGHEDNPWDVADPRRATQDAKFIECSVTNCDGHAFFIHESVDCTFDNCQAHTLAGNGFLLRNNIDGSEDGFVVSKCTATACSIGFNVYGHTSEPTYLANSLVEKSSAYACTDHGIKLARSTNTIVRDCVALGTDSGGSGIALLESNETQTIERCESSGHDTGMEISADTDGTDIEYCVFTNNTTHVSDAGTNTTQTGVVKDTDTFDTFSAGDTTPDVSGTSLARTANTSETVITDFDNGTTSQEFTLLIDDAFTTILSNENISLSGDVPIGPNSLGPLIRFQEVSGVWVEQYRIAR